MMKCCCPGFSEEYVCLCEGQVPVRQAGCHHHHQADCEYCQCQPLGRAVPLHCGNVHNVIVHSARNLSVSLTKWPSHTVVQLQLVLLLLVKSEIDVLTFPPSYFFLFFLYVHF